MDKYRRVPKEKTDQEQIGPNEIRVMAQRSARNYISYAIQRLTAEGPEAQTNIILKGMGRAIHKTVNIAEIIKRRVADLHQTTSLESNTLVDVFEPTMQGLSRKEIQRTVSSITIILSKEPLDTANPGYQAPLPAEQVQPESKERAEQPRRGGGGRRGRGGRGRGFGTRGRGLPRGAGGRGAVIDAPQQTQQPTRAPVPRGGGRRGGGGGGYPAQQNFGGRGDRGFGGGYGGDNRQGGNFGGHYQQQGGYGGRNDGGYRQQQQQQDGGFAHGGGYGGGGGFGGNAYGAGAGGFRGRGGGGRGGRRGGRRGGPITHE